MNKLIRLALVAVFLLTFFAVIPGCSPSSKLVGKWQETSSNAILEFTEDGSLVLNSGGNFYTGTYQLVTGDVIKVKLSGLVGASLSLFGNDTWQYEISGNTMVLTVSGKGSTILKRK